MAPPRRRVSYIIPPPTETVPRLQLPPHNVSQLGSTGPLLLHYENLMGDADVEAPWTRHPRHRLGVASLALDTSTQLEGRDTPEGILYTGGRDGLVMSWDLGIPMKHRERSVEGDSEGRLRRTVGRWEIMTGWADDATDEEMEDVDERSVGDGDILGDVVLRRRRHKSRGDSPIPYEQQWDTDLEAFQPNNPSQFRQCAQTHTDWVNDILLCNYNQTVVSASSDGTIKAWSPHLRSSPEPSTIGSHADYVRCLAQCREQNWIASGSFDRTIKLWDLSRSAASDSTDPLLTMNPPDASAPKSSVYAIAADPFGHAIASGSPERVIRMWDPRSGKRTGKLVGHTDNIRAILVSDDSRYLLTGSADASIKLWSLASQRCLHTFMHHTESVWSLFSSHPSLEIFYSGDKSGLVCKVDVEDCTDVSEGECVVLCQDTSERNVAASEGINKVIAMDDNLFWTASGNSSIKRWRAPQRRAVRASALIVDTDTAPSESPVSTFRKRSSPSLDLYTPSPRVTLHDPPVHLSRTSAARNSLAPSLSGSIISEHWQPHRDREDESRLYGIPFESLVRLTSPNDRFAPYPSMSRNRDPEVATLYSAASIMSVPRASAGRSPMNLLHSPPAHSGTRGDTLPSRAGEDTVQPVNSARADFEERELAADAVPLYTVPDDVIHGDHGLVRSIILNDRMHALTVDTSGEVAVWNIIKGGCLGKYRREDVAAASHAGSVAGGSGCEGDRSPREALEAVRERIEGEAVVMPWSAVDTKTGVLTVHLTERCFEAEVYADEAGIGPDRHFNDETRLNIGRWVLRNLFRAFIREETRTHRHRENSSHDSVLQMNLPAPVELTTTNGHRRSSSDPSMTALSRGTVVSSPGMVPAITPAVPSTVRTSPLLVPMINLQNLARDNLHVLPSIPQSPNDATPLPLSRHLRSQSTDSGQQTAPSPSASKEGDYFTVRSRQPPISSKTSEDLPSTANVATPSRQSVHESGQPGGFMGRLKNFGKNASKKIGGDVTNSPVLGGVNAVDVPMVGERSSNPVPAKPKTPAQALLSGPLNPPPSTECPIISPFPNFSLIISEEGSPNWVTIYRGATSSTAQDVHILEEAMPMWLLEFLLTNKYPPVAVNKISFVMLPWPNKDQEGGPLPELLNTAQSKLTASRFLRVRKLTTHVQDKLEKLAGNSAGIAGSTSRTSLDSQTSSSVSRSRGPPAAPARPKAEDLYEILCGDVVLPLDMTLAVVRQFVWRQAAELIMYYRRRRVGKPQK